MVITPLWSEQMENLKNEDSSGVPKVYRCYCFRVDVEAIGLHKLDNTMTFNIESTFLTFSQHFICLHCENLKARNTLEGVCYERWGFFVFEFPTHCSAEKSSCIFISYFFIKWSKGGHSIECYSPLTITWTQAWNSGLQKFLWLHLNPICRVATSFIYW